jgi:hypothetical protein
MIAVPALLRACFVAPIALRKFALAAALTGLAPLAHAAPSSININYQNADWAIGSAYTEARARSDWKELKYWDPNATLTIKQWDAANNYRGLRVKLARDQVLDNSGMIYVTNLANGTDYTYEYRVYFEPGFEFNRGNGSTNYGGGKLPGLAGGSQPSGGQPNSDGFSARLMFRRDTTRSQPYIELYQYWRGQKGTYADQVFLQTVTTGTWYKIKQRIRLGTQTSPGRIQIWVNDVPRCDKYYQYLSAGKTWRINGVMQHVFMGGDKPEWAPTKDTYLILDNQRVDTVAF